MVFASDWTEELFTMVLMVLPLCQFL